MTEETAKQTGEDEPKLRPKKLQGMSAGQIRIRLALVQRVMQEAKEKGDERWKNLVAQEQELTAALEKSDREAGKPAPTVIGMKPAKLDARRPGI